MTDQPASGPGRKRSQASRRAILDSALELIVETGYAGLTVDGIAARSGTGKQTVYRWWPSKAYVLMDALATNAELHIPVPDEGSYRSDLREFLAASFRLGRDPRIRDVLRALMAQAQIDPEFGERFRVGFLQRRRDALAHIVERAQARGDLPRHPSKETIADIVFGVIWYRMLAREQPWSDDLEADLLATLTGVEPSEP